MAESALSLTSEVVPAEELTVEDDWEEWDGRSPFWIHCVAGSLAGVTEHVLVYPLDTVRTHIQVCASCVVGKPSSNPKVMPSSLIRSALHNHKTSTTALPTGMWQTIRYLVNQPALELSGADLTAAAAGGDRTFGVSRLWRGVNTMLIGCVPAHALYFSAYEFIKGLAPKQDGQVSAVGSSLAGAAATFSHDCVLTPLDTIKQRMQLGHYSHGSVHTALTQIVQTEGWSALYRSFPVTLATNVPYGMIMVSTIEACKQLWTSDSTAKPSLGTVLAASAAGGAVASACTTPLDRIKTSLQTQHLAPVCARTAAACPRHVANGVPLSSWTDAARSIATTEGVNGFFRGVCPRVLSHTPAVAISWTTYECLKQYLLKQYGSS